MMFFLLSIVEPTTNAYLADFDNSNILLRLTYFLRHFSGSSAMFSFGDFGWTHIVGMLTTIGIIFFVIRICLLAVRSFKIQKFERKEK